MLCFSKVFSLKSRKVFRKIRMDFREIDPQLQILTICWMNKGNMYKNSQGSTIVHRFHWSIWFHTQREDGANTICIWSPQTATAIMMCCKNKKTVVCSPYGDIDSFNIVTGVLQGDTLEPYMFMICQNYVRWIWIDLIKENSFTLNKARCRWYPAETITDIDYTVDLPFQQMHLSKPNSCGIAYLRTFVYLFRYIHLFSR